MDSTRFSSDALTVLWVDGDGVPISPEAWKAAQDQAKEQGCSLERAAIDLLLTETEKE